MKTLIKNVYVLTMDDQMSEYPAGYVVIQGENIVAVGDERELTEGETEFEKVIDGKGGILLPGMINVHTHTGMIPFRSLADDVPDRLRRFLFPLEQYMTKKLARASSQYAVAEMLLSGVTTFSDMYYFEDDIAQVCDEMKVRAFLGETIIDMATCDSSSPKESLAYCEVFIQKWQKHPLITPMIAPHAPNTNSEETLKAVCEISRKYEAPIMIHVSEMDYELVEIAQKNQQTPVAFLQELGYFDQLLIMAHCILVTEEDIALIGKHRDKVSIAHCIGANTKSAKGVAPIPAMLKQGITVGLGTDGPSSGNTLDLFCQMKLFANFHKTYAHDRSLFPAKEIVTLATRGGAKVLGIEDKVGVIEIGKKADMIIVETDSANMFPIHDPYAVLVYSANASNVRDVWVNGQQLVAEKQLVYQDLNQIRRTLSKEMVQFEEEAKKL